jgi:hypothetical protein
MFIITKKEKEKRKKFRRLEFRRSIQKRIIRVQKPNPNVDDGLGFLK